MSSNSATKVCTFERAAAGNRASQPVVASTAAAPAPSARLCEQCGGAEAPGGSKFRSCSTCHLAYYCGTECQRLHWKEGGHRELCKPTAGAQEATIPPDFVHSRTGVAVSLSEGKAQEAPALRRGTATLAQQAGDAAFEWDINVWQHSKPAIFSAALGAGCMQGESTVCSIQAFGGARKECHLRMLCLAEVVGIGVGTKSKKNLLETFWKYSSDGSKYCSSSAHILPYGEPFGAGDCITVSITDQRLEFAKNGKPLGAAFTGFSESKGPFFLRVHLMNSLPVKKRHTEKVMQRVRALNAAGASPTAEQLHTMLNNVGTASRSDPGSGRSEMLILPDGPSTL